MANYGGSDGVRDSGGLESVLAYPKKLAAYGDPGLADLATGYLFSKAKNHAFVNCTKCTF